MSNIQYAALLFVLAIANWLMSKLGTNPIWLSSLFVLNAYITGVLGSLRLIVAIMEKKS